MKQCAYRMIIMVFFGLWVGRSGYANERESPETPVYIEIDLDHDGILETLSFEPRETPYNLDKAEPIVCRLSKNNDEYIAFEADATSGEILTFNEVKDWKISDTEHILMVEIEHDHRAAVASSHNQLNFFLINSYLMVKKLGSIEGGYEQHHSVSSGSRAEATVSFMNVGEEPYFLIEYIDRFVEFDPERSNCQGAYSRITTAHVKLTYHAEKKTFEQEQLDSHDEELCEPNE